MSRPPQNFDPEEFHAQGTYLWRLVYPSLLVSFYLLMLVGWIFLRLKWWLVALGVVYLVVGFANFNFVMVPSSAVRGDRITSRELLFSLLLYPCLLLFFPVVHLFMVVRVGLKEMAASRRH